MLAQILREGQDAVLEFRAALRAHVPLDRGVDLCPHGTGTRDQTLSRSWSWGICTV